MNLMRSQIQRPSNLDLLLIGQLDIHLAKIAIDDALARTVIGTVVQVVAA